jgi:hypothetical protein
MSTSFQGPEGGIFHFLLQGYANLSTLFFCEDTSIVGLDKWQTRICSRARKLLTRSSSLLRRTTDKYMRCHVEEILFAIWARSHFRSTVCIQYPSSSGALYWWGSNYAVQSSCSNCIGQFSLQYPYSHLCVRLTNTVQYHLQHAIGISPVYSKCFNSHISFIGDSSKSLDINASASRTRLSSPWVLVRPPFMLQSTDT